MELKIQSPLKNMPDCWQNEERMNVLMAPFRKRDVNPLDWDSKMKFWKNCINMWTSDNKQFRFSILDLQKSFDRKGRTPKCLSTVLENMMKNGELMLESDFLKMMPTHNESWASWTVKLVVKTPATWAFEKMKRSLFDTLVNDPDVQFVHLNVLKEMGEQFVETVQKDNSLEILTIEKVKEILQISCPETVNLIIHWLHLKGLVNVLKHNNITLVKLITNQSKSKGICEVDVAIFTLKENEKELMKALGQLELEKHEAEQEARSYIRKGMRQVAKGCIRKKKALEKCIDKRAAALANVQILLSRIQETESDSQVFDAYKIGLSAIKSAFKEAGLSENNVFSTMDQVKETLDLHDEIQESLAEPIGESIDADLEKELAALLVDVPLEEPGALPDFELPNVPSGPPSPEEVVETKKKQQKVAV